MPQINLGTVTNDNTGNPLRTGGLIINQYGLLGDKTVNAAFYKTASITNEAAITAAIVAAASLGAGAAVWVPASMLPYNASLVTFNAAVRMIREGGNPDVFDIQAYGAKGDFVQDDSPNIRGAIAGAQASGAAAVVWSPRALTAYAIGSRVTVSGSNITLSGVRGSTWKAIANLNDTVLMCEGSDATPLTDLKLDGLTIDGNLANQGAGVSALATVQVGFVIGGEITNCEVLNGYGAAFQARHSQRLLIQNNRLVGWRGTGILVCTFANASDAFTTVSKEHRIIGNYLNANLLQQTAGDGIFTPVYGDSTLTIGTNRQTDIDIIDNIIIGVNDTGIEISVGSVRGTITGNVVDGAGNALIGGATSSAGISVADGQYITVASNVVGNYGAAPGVAQDGIAIFARGSAVLPSFVSIVGNVISRAPRRGISINTSSSYVTVVGNTSVDAQTSDIVVAAGLTGYVQGWNNFVTAGASTTLGPNASSGASPTVGTMTYAGNAAVVFQTGGGGATGQALRTASGSPAAVEVGKGDFSDYDNFRAAALFTTKVAPTAAAGQVAIGATTASTVGAAGGASALPATPLGYLIINVAGTQAKLPYYNT